MAVFPDRIVLKNSTDSQASIIAAIGAGGADEITQGELVIGVENSTITLYTKAANGDIVTFDPGSASGRAIVSDTPPTVGINGAPLQEGDLWFEPDAGGYYIYYVTSATAIASYGAIGATTSAFSARLSNNSVDKDLSAAISVRISNHRLSISLFIW